MTTMYALLSIGKKFDSILHEQNNEQHLADVRLTYA